MLVGMVYLTLVTKKDEKEKEKILISLLKIKMN